MLEPVFYIQGYKIDPQKIRELLHEENEPDENRASNWYDYILTRIPETAYKYVGTGVEPDGTSILVLVLEIGQDEAKMRKHGIKTPDTLPRQSLQLLTPGVWQSGDSDSEELFQLHGVAQG